MQSPSAREIPRNTEDEIINQGVTTLNALPDELLLEILSYFAVTPDPTKKDDWWRGDRMRHKTLQSVCLTSKRMLGIAEPLYYRVYIWDEAEPDDNMWPFIDALIRRPQVAKYVKYLRLSPWTNYAGLDEDENEDGISQRLKLVRQLYGQEDGLLKDWESAIRHGYEDAQAALLLILCPNVTELVITVPDYQINKYFRSDYLPLIFRLMDRAVRGQKTGQLHGFSSLARFTAKRENPFNYRRAEGFILDFMPVVLRLPAIVSFKGELVSETMPLPRLDWPADGTSTLEDIDFKDSEIGEETIGAIVKACRAVKSFSCEWTRRDNTARKIRLPFIRSVLTHHQSSLRFLEIDTRLWHDPTSRPPGRRVQIPELEPIGSLREFESLQYLGIGPAALLGHNRALDAQLSDYLPSSLQVLVVNEWFEGLEAYLLNLANHADLFPYLRHVGVPHRIHLSQSRSSYQAKFAEAGIEVVIPSQSGKTFSKLDFTFSDKAER